MRLMIAAAVSVVTLSACGANETGAPAPTATDAGNGTAAKASPAPRHPNPGVGDVADLRFTAKTLAGKAFSGEQLAGKPAVLWFWAPWCPTCRAQAPNVSDLGEKYRGTAAVVGVAGLATEEMIKDLAPQIRNITHLVDVEGTVWDHFGVEAQSTYTLIDKDGRIVSDGYLDDDELNRRVAAMVERNG